jgi:hypothetical protein
MLANEVNPARSRIGHDVSAYILLRSLCEYVDVMALLIDKPDLLAEFRQNDYSKANSFWHHHVKSLEARKTVIAAAKDSEWYK